MKHTRNVIKGFAFFLLCLTLLVNHSSLFAVQAKTVGQGIDVIMLLDCSGSMKNSDPKKLTLEGANLLLDLFDKDTSRYGAIMFDGEIRGTIPLHSISTIRDIMDMRDALTGQYGQNGLKTDTARALGRALQMFKTNDIGNDRLIVLLTDGVDDPSRSMEELLAERSAVMQEASDLNIPVYTIGLNVDGSMSQESIEEISAQTGAATYEVTKAEQLNTCILDIYERFVTESQTVRTGENEINGSFTREPQQIPVHIPDPYMSNANISIFTGAEVDVKLFAPDGRDVVGDPDKVYINQMDTYTLVQIIRPAKGDWLLQVQGKEGVDFSIKFIYDYTLKLAAEASGYSSGTPFAGDFMLSAYLYNDQGKVTDTDIYDSVQAVTFDVTDGSGKHTLLTGTLNGDVYTVSDDTLPEGVYTVTASLSHAAFDRMSDPLTVTLANPATGTSPQSSSAPAASAKPAVTANPQSATKGDIPWLVIGLVIAALALLIGAIVVLFMLKIGPFQEKRPIKASLTIRIGNNEGFSATAYNKEMFYESSYTRTTLADVVKYTGTDMGSRELSDLAEYVLLTGVKNGIVFTTRKADIVISADQHYQSNHKKPYLQTEGELYGDEVLICFKDACETEIRITANE